MAVGERQEPDADHSEHPDERQRGQTAAMTTRSWSDENIMKAIPPPMAIEADKEYPQTIRQLLRLVAAQTVPVTSSHAPGLAATMNRRADMKKATIETIEPMPRSPVRAIERGCPGRLDRRQ